MTIVETQAYLFDELEEEAKEAARYWFRTDYPDYDWWECIYEDAANVGLKITSFELYRGGDIDGHCTEEAKRVARNIYMEHGLECRTWKTARSWLYQHEWDDDQFTREILYDYLFMLRDEYEYLFSDEQVDESIRANEYLFTESGRRTVCL